MKVAYTIGSINRGGTETLLLDTFRQWQSAPFEMMLVHRNGGGLKEELYAAGPNCFELAPWRGRYLSYLLQLRKLFRQQHVDVIHAQYWLDALYARLATIGLHIPIVLTFHGYFLKHGWMKVLIKIAILCTKKVCFVSETEKKLFISHYGNIIQNRAIVNYNGVDFNKFDNLVSIPLDIVHSRNVVNLCMVGNFVSGRNQMILIQALELLRERGYINWNMYFIGRIDRNSPWRYQECIDYCNAHTIENVYFLGGRSDVPAILKQMDCFVYSSRSDTFGIAVLEAIASGIPIVVNDLPELIEISGGESYSIRFYKTNDVLDCANKIQQFLDNYSISAYAIQQTALYNKGIVRNRFSIEQHISRLNTIYQQIIL